MNLAQTSKQKWREIAEHLAALSAGLEINEVENYTSLRLGPGKLTNCVTISRRADSASFLSPSPEFSTIEAAGLRAQPMTSRAKAFAGSQYRVHGVSIEAINRNHQLFKKLVTESVRSVTELQRGSNHA
jgi:hypothetical protein